LRACSLIHQAKIAVNAKSLERTIAVKGIAYFERNRSRFIAEAVERTVENELAQCRREELLWSLQRPIPRALRARSAGLVDWGASVRPTTRDSSPWRLASPCDGARAKGWVAESA
jgi:hypothetical protein